MPRARIATPFHDFCPRHTELYPARASFSAGNSASVPLSSCRQTASGVAARSQASRFARRLLMLLMLNGVIYTRGMSTDDSKAEKKARQSADAKIAWAEHLAKKAAVDKNTERLRAL